MTIKTAIGNVSGSRDAPSVTVTVFDDAHATLGYDAALAAAIAAAPATVFGANLKTAEIGISEQSRDAITFEMGYARPGANTLLRDNSVQTKSKKLYSFIAPVGVFGVSGADETSSHANVKWKLDRQGSAAEFNSGKPVAVDPLANSRNLRYSTSQSFVTDPYLDLVEDMVNRGVFNAAIYLGRSIGSLQLVSFSVTENDVGDWSLGFGFGYQAFQTSVDVGDGVLIPELRGCDYFWPIEIETYSSDSIQPKVKAVVVGQAWPFDDFSQLNMPYPGQLTTRNGSGIAGTITTLEGHGITASDDCIIFWDGGTQIAVVSSVTTTTVVFGSGTGDALPPLDSHVLVAKYVP